SWRAPSALSRTTEWTPRPRTPWKAGSTPTPGTPASSAPVNWRTPWERRHPPAGSPRTSGTPHWTRPTCRGWTGSSTCGSPDSDDRAHRPAPPAIATDCANEPVDPHVAGPPDRRTPGPPRGRTGEPPTGEPAYRRTGEPAYRRTGVPPNRGITARRLLPHPPNGHRQSVPKSRKPSIEIGRATCRER